MPIIFKPLPPDLLTAADRPIYQGQKVFNEEQTLQDVAVRSTARQPSEINYRPVQLPFFSGASKNSLIPYFAAAAIIVYLMTKK